MGNAPTFIATFIDGRGLFMATFMATFIATFIGMGPRLPGLGVTGRETATGGKRSFEPSSI